MNIAPAPAPALLLDRRGIEKGFEPEFEHVSLPASL